VGGAHTHSGGEQLRRYYPPASPWSCPHRRSWTLTSRPGKTSCPPSAAMHRRNLHSATPRDRVRRMFSSVADVRRGEWSVRYRGGHRLCRGHALNLQTLHSLTRCQCELDEIQATPLFITQIQLLPYDNRRVPCQSSTVRSERAGWTRRASHRSRTWYTSLSSSLQ
jgi:hypothetical protein